MESPPLVTRQGNSPHCLCLPSPPLSLSLSISSLQVTPRDRHYFRSHLYTVQQLIRPSPPLHTLTASHLQHRDEVKNPGCTAAIRDGS
ncbi:hypothetical protein B566_EDAN004845 [Ephemera danica]|nr:hypothetical protein B566_EDAN004845 [Ephemera danica]